MSSLDIENLMIDPDTVAIMDKIVRPVLDSESRDLNDKVRRAAEWAAQAGVPGSGLAFFKQIAAYFDHYRDLAKAVWAGMLRVLDETRLHLYPELPKDLKQQFDAYMSGPAQRMRASMQDFQQMRRSMPNETFDDVFERTREKYHIEIDLRCRRAESEHPAARISIGELNMGDSYAAGQAGAMGPNAHAHDISFHQINAEQLGQLDMRTLAVELSSLRREMKQLATEPEHDIAVGQIAAAETAVKKGETSTLLGHLKSAGKWAFDVATKIGVNVASEAIKRSMGP